MPDVMPASRTNRPFFNVSEHLKTLMFIGISSFYLSHRISGGNMTDSVLRDPVLRDLGSGGRAERTHIGNDMRQRVIRSWSDSPRPRYLRHIYKPEKHF
jgi:hypothetical protein